ncbi:sensor histidine kinase YesM [Paenibacillus montaniterrae]|uniref:histidine kinase n=2 Tax=Paenibacillus montaniterrae TaxID=429341 RepID=A0A919YNS7_9BACL|nr:sensor histidine kinase YesM [Paenibacillus montaniterrae]
MKFFGNVSLGRQLLYLITIMLVVLLLSFVVTNIIAQQIVEQKVTESTNKILLQVEESVESFYGDMEGISYSLLYSPTIQSYLSADDVLDRILMNSDIEAQFSSTTSLKDTIKGIQIYNSSGEMIGSIGEMTHETEAKTTEIISYSGVYEGQGRLNKYYTIAVPIYNLKSDRFIRDYRGMCLFIMDVSNFETILRKSKITENAQLLLLDQHGQVIVSASNTDVEAKDREQLRLGGSEEIVQTIALPDTGWELISVIPKQELFEDMNVIWRLNIATYAIVFLLLCLFMATFYSRLLRPIKALMEFVRTYPKKGRQSRFSIRYYNEIGVLGGSLNQMLDDIDALSESIQLAQKQMYETELSKNRMELAVYRHQINPHFLYNTLEAIRGLALYNKVHDLADITSSLSSMYRYSVKGDNAVTVWDELVHLRQYATIIQFRFRGKIQIQIEADEQLYSKPALKMLLQPLVENAVFHGLEKKIAPGTAVVSITALDEHRIQYVIQDDGCGIEQDKLEQLRASWGQFRLVGQAEMKESSQGIGLTNIYRRLKLYYGEAASMELESERDKGTTVTITFDVREKLE